MNSGPLIKIEREQLLIVNRVEKDLELERIQRNIKCWELRNGGQISVSVEAEIDGGLGGLVGLQNYVGNNF